MIMRKYTTARLLANNYFYVDFMWPLTFKHIFVTCNTFNLEIMKIYSHTLFCFTYCVS
jgi:hypothetical protein